MEYYEYKSQRDKLDTHINFIHSDEVIDFSHTFITEKYSDKVDQSVYKYYKLYDYQKFDEVESEFTPNKDDVFLKGTGSNQWRMIFYNNYDDEEIEKYEEFLKQVDELEDSDLKSKIKALERNVTIHMIQS